MICFGGRVPAYAIFFITSKRTGDDASLSAGLPVTAFLRSGAQVNGMDFTSETADGSIPSSTLKLASIEFSAGVF